jgi:hypothetical protein
MTFLIVVGDKLYGCVSLNHTCTGIFIVKEQNTTTKA